MQNEIQIEPVLIEYPVPEKENKLFSLLKGAGNKLKDVGSNSKNVLSDLLLGREVQEPETVVTADKIESGVNNGGRQGGLANFVNDVALGTKENLNTPFNANNLLPSKKGFGYRLGEALGTGARLLDNSLVRGAIAYGLSKRYGDTNPLEQGLTAASMNMQNKTADKIYRDSLAQQGFDTSNIGGYITPQTYNSILQAKQLQDNAEWRKANLEAQQNQNKILNDLRQRELNLGYAKLKADKEEKQDKRNNESDTVIKQLEELMALHSKLPQYGAGKGLQKGTSILTGALSDVGLRTDEIAAYEGVQNMMTNLVARKLAGEKGVMTDKDFDRAKKMVPNIYDSPQQAKAKYQALLSLYYANPNNVKTTTQKDSLGIL